MMAQSLSARSAVLTGFGTLILLIAGFGTWSATSHISGAIIASGQVQADQRRQVVQHPDGGVVTRISVRDGDHVSVGQVLLSLDGEMLRSKQAIVNGQFYEQLARRARSEAECANRTTLRFAHELLAAAGEPSVAEMIAGQENLFQARIISTGTTLEKIDRQTDQMRAQITGIDARRAALSSQIRLIQKELTGQRSLLDKGLAQSARVLALEHEAANPEGQDGALASNRAQAEGRITELELERVRELSTRQEQAETTLRDTGARELELAERRRTLAGRIAQPELRAPVAGIVYDMTVTPPRG